MTTRTLTCDNTRRKWESVLLSQIGRGSWSRPSTGLRHSQTLPSPQPRQPHENTPTPTSAQLLLPPVHPRCDRMQHVVYTHTFPSSIVSPALLLCYHVVLCLETCIFRDDGRMKRRLEACLHILDVPPSPLGPPSSSLATHPSSELGDFTAQWSQHAAIVVMAARKSI